MMRVVESRSVRVKVLLPVVLGFGVTALGAGLGVVSLQQTGRSEQRLYARNTRALGDFASLRDDMGDASWEIRDYILSSSASSAASSSAGGRAAVLDEI